MRVRCSLQLESDKIFALVNTVLAFENSKGHLKWKVTEIARASKVSKSLVYYYLGSTKEQILDSSIRIGSEEFYGLSPERVAMVKGGDLVGSLMYTRQIFLKNYAFSAFYLRWISTPTEIGEKLREYDARYQKKLKLLYPHLTEKERTALRAIFNGLIVAPVMDEAVLKTALAWLPLKA